jgi:hypothetical protein
MAADLFRIEMIFITLYLGVATAQRRFSGKRTAAAVRPTLPYYRSRRRIPQTDLFPARAQARATG